MINTLSVLVSPYFVQLCSPQSGPLGYISAPSSPGKGSPGSLGGSVMLPVEAGQFVYFTVERRGGGAEAFMRLLDFSSN